MIFYNVSDFTALISAQNIESPNIQTANIKSPKTNNKLPKIQIFDLNLPNIRWTDCLPQSSGCLVRSAVQGVLLLNFDNV